VHPKEPQIAVGLEHQILILDTNNGAILRRVPESGRVAAVAFAADGSKFLSVAVHDRHVLVRDHPMNVEQLMQRVCGLLTCNLTKTEWRDMLGSEPYHRTCSNLP
jgi:hypothetical protein